MTSFDLVLPRWPIAEIRPLLSSGTRIWLAGGAVRDLLLKHSPHDWDFVITGSGLRLARAVADKLGGAYYALDSERQTGRAIVVDPASNLRITLDFAALREATIVQDLLGRDFTLNAMAVTFEGQLIDPTGGQQDLRDRKLRMVSPGCFAADSIRLLRAARLATQLSLTLEEATRARIQAEAGAIEEAAAERVRAELIALMSLPEAAEGLSTLAELGLLEHVIPELGRYACDVRSGPTYDADEAGRRIAVVASLVRLHQSLAEQPIGSCDEVDLPCALARANPELLNALNAHLAEPVGAEVTRGDLIRWAAVFTPNLPNAGANLADARMSELHFSRAAVDYVRLIVESQDPFRRLASSGMLAKAGNAELQAPRQAVYRYYRNARQAGIAAALLALARRTNDPAFDSDATWPVYLATARILIETYLTQRSERVDPTPLLTGHDLLALGVAPGPPVGETLALLREAQATGQVCSNAQARAFVLRSLQQPQGDRKQISGEPL